MATYRYRKDTRRWGVDYVDETGKRRWITCASENEAKLLLAEKMRRPGGDPNVSFAAVAERWLNSKRRTVRPQTWESYERRLRIHFLPRFGSMRFGKITRGMLFDFLSEKMGEMAAHSVGGLVATLHNIYEFAMEFEDTGNNRLRGLRKRLGIAKLSLGGPVKALLPKQLAQFFETARAMVHDKSITLVIYTLFFLMARAGLRINEVTALKWTDIEFDKMKIFVQRTWTDLAQLQEYPKTAKSHRRVDMSPQLHEALRKLQRKQKEDKLAFGWRDVPDFVFTTREGTPMRHRAFASKKFKAILKRAGLPRHFSSHSLRHTFACHHLQNGAKIAWVQQQLGHTSISMTVDRYGSWFPISDQDAASRLDDVGTRGEW